jgi:hypothetical protein
MIAEPRVILRFTTQSGQSSGSLHVTGFAHLWAVYVRSFDQRYHCQRCLRGRLSERIRTSTTLVDTDLCLDETSIFDSIYVCGVARGPRSSRSVKNLHLPLERSPGTSLTCSTYNGYLVHVSNASLLEIPELPYGWMGLSAAYVKCCNFRFGVHRFGYRHFQGDQDKCATT